MGTVLILLFAFVCRCSLQPTHSSPLVVITFDDADTSIGTIAFPLMKSMNSTWAATHFLPVTFAGSPGFCTVDQLREMEAHGWESGGHGYTHENLSSVPLDSAEIQIEQSYQFLKHNHLSHESFAFPFGNYNEDVLTLVKKRFRNIRTSHDFQYLDGVKRTELGYFAVKGGHTTHDIIARVERARAAGAPLVIIGFHKILHEYESPVPTYWCRESTFRDFLEYLKQEELPVLTLKEAMNRLCR